MENLVKPFMFFISLFVITLFSCSLNLDEDYPYDKFSNFDFDYIPTFYREIGKIIKFKNQYDEEIRFETSIYSIERKFYNGLNFVGNTAPSKYYDELYINILLLDMEIEGKPDYYCQDIDITITKKYNGELLHNVSIPTYDAFCTYENRQFETPQINVEEMEINNKIYDKVIEFEVWSDSYYTLYNNSTIHKVYYDLKYGIIGFDEAEGIIGFDDLENNKWRIVN